MNNCTNTTNMFYNCANLNTIPNLNLSKVTDTSYMFYGCVNLDISHALNLPMVIRFNNMFQNNSNIKQITITNMPNSSTTYANFYTGCTSLESLVIENSITNMNLLTITLASLRRLVLSGYQYNLNVSNCNLSREAIVELFTGLATVTSRTITVTGNFGSPNLTAADKLIATSKGWTVAL